MKQMMDSLLKALEIDVQSNPVIAAVGGGGKSSLLFRLMEELTVSGRKVIVTTTTHMAFEPERPFAEDGDRDKIREDLEKYRYTVTATLERDKGKIGSLPKETLNELRKQADVLLIEADGAKRLPLKIPGKWEPVIPAFTDLVIGVIGMDAVGQPIGRICHRPELVAAFLGKTKEKTVTAEDVVRIAASAKGLKKEVSDRQYRVFLNKTDLPGKQETAAYVSEQLKRQQMPNAWGSLQRRNYYR